MLAGEIAVTFPCRGDELIGVVHRPTGGLGMPDGMTSAAVPRGAQRGVVIVVGGPQYRVGSHRQFVLLARQLTAAGIPALRFDCRGMGDGDGAFPGFAAIGDDIAAAIDALCAAQPEVREVVLWGLCDAASAILFYADGDRRVAGVVLLNPWVRSDGGLARAYLRHYYLGRLIKREFWRKLGRGEFDFPGSLRSLIETIRDALGGVRSAKAACLREAPAFAEASAGKEAASLRRRQAGQPAPPMRQDASLAARMGDGLRRFRGRVLLITSGRDLVAQEFNAAATEAPWRGLLQDARVERQVLAAADHTFSTAAWRGQVADWTIRWLRSW
jgi:exosortase A-associated hydrolase 1